MEAKLTFRQLQMDKLTGKPVSWGSVVMLGIGGTYVVSPQTGERWVCHPASVLTFQEHTEHLAQY